MTLHVLSILCCCCWAGAQLGRASGFLLSLQWCLAPLQWLVGPPKCAQWLVGRHSLLSLLVGAAAVETQGAALQGAPLPNGQNGAGGPGLRSGAALRQLPLLQVCILTVLQVHALQVRARLRALRLLQTQVEALRPPPRSLCRSRPCGSPL